MYFEKIINLETGEETLRPYTKEEIAEVDKFIAESEAKQIKEEAEKASKKAALEKLSALGLTETDLKALGL